MPTESRSPSISFGQECKWNHSESILQENNSKWKCCKIELALAYLIHHFWTVRNAKAEFKHCQKSAFSGLCWQVPAIQCCLRQWSAWLCMALPWKHNCATASSSLFMEWIRLWNWPHVNIIFLIDEEGWCLLLPKCSHNHRRHSATNTLLFHWKSCSLGLGSCCSPRVSSLQGQASTSSGTRKVMDWELDTGTVPWGCCIAEHISRNTAMALLMFRLPKSL